jgi:hypothetical protein
MPFWVAVRTVRNHDRLAVESVCQAGFEIFATRVRERFGSRWRTTPLFAGYFFVRVVDRWRAIERTIVKVGATPAKCPDLEIAALLERSDPDGIIRLAARPSSPPRRIFTPGATVATADGRAGECGRFEPIGDRGTAAADGAARRDHEGYDWPMEIEERGAGPSAAVAELKAAAETDRSDGGSAVASSRWIRPLTCYGRRETTEVHGTRYG